MAKMQVNECDSAGDPNRRRVHNCVSLCSQVSSCPMCYWSRVEKYLQKNEEMESKGKQRPVVHVTGDGRKVRCCKELYCKGIWDVSSMNQGKLEVVKRETTRVNINSLGISELRWTGIRLRDKKGNNKK